MTTRRTFLKSSAAAPRRRPSPAACPPKAGDKLTIGLIGCGGMGKNHLKLLAKNKQINIAYVCDADEKRLADAAKIADDRGPQAPKPMKDLRQVLDDKAVNAVWIATPDHWHAAGAILAAGRRQARLRREAVLPQHPRRPADGRGGPARTRSNIQVGTQSRSTQTVPRRDGPHPGRGDRRDPGGEGLEQPTAAKLGHVKPSEPPPHIDFDLWLGPAPEAPFYTNRVHGIWRFFMDFGCGDIGNDGVHDIDVGCWGLGVDSLPNRVAAASAASTSSTTTSSCPTRSTPSASTTRATAGRGRGSSSSSSGSGRPTCRRATRTAARSTARRGCSSSATASGWKLYGERNKPVEQMTGKVDLPAHHQNFLDACLKGGKLAAPGGGRAPLRGHLPPGEHQRPAAARPSSSTRTERSRTTRRRTRCSAASTARPLGGAEGRVIHRIRAFFGVVWRCAVS